MLLQTHRQLDETTDKTSYIVANMRLEKSKTEVVRNNKPDLAMMHPDCITPCSKSHAKYVRHMQGQLDKTASLQRQHLCFKDGQNGNHVRMKMEK